MMNDVFTPSAFTLSSLTAQINNLVYAPMRLSGLFEESGIATTSAAIGTGLALPCRPRPHAGAVGGERL